MSYKLADVIWNDDGTMVANKLTPIKALEQFSKLVFIHGGVEQYRLIEKSLKGLEIIKETEMLSVFQDLKGICYLVVNNIAIEITKEKYDLLKEVLS